MPRSNKQNFLQGAMVLSVATALVKIIGALFKIPMQNLIGPQGMTHFTMAYNIYATLFVISTAGLPVAVSKMVSEANAQRRFGEMRTIFRTALSCFIVIGALGSGFLFFGAHLVAQWMNNPSAFLAIRTISPAVLLVAIMAAFRGYHQGQGNMYPTAISQVIEALCKLFIGYALASWIFHSFINSPHMVRDVADRLSVWVSQVLGADAGQKVLAVATDWMKNAASPSSAAGAIGGITIGSFVGALYLIFFSRRMETAPRGATMETRSRRSILKQLLKLAIPVTISAAVLNLTNLIDQGLVMGRLQSAAGFSVQDAEKLYGSYTFAQTLFNLPSAFILTLSVSIIPTLSVALAKRDHLGANRTIESALRVTSLLAMPAAAGFMALSFPILNLLNGNRQPEAVRIAAPLLMTLGLAVTFVCLVSLTNAILQSMGKVYIPIVTMLVGGLLKILTNFFLVGNRDINIAGAPVGTVVCYAAIAILNLLCIARLSGSAHFFKVFVKPLIASAAMGFVASGSYAFLVGSLHLSARLSTVGAIVVAVVFYFVVVLLLRVLPKEDFLLLPKGEKLAKLLKL